MHTFIWDTWHLPHLFWAVFVPVALHDRIPKGLGVLVGDIIPMNVKSELKSSRSTFLRTLVKLLFQKIHLGRHGTSRQEPLKSV